MDLAYPGAVLLLWSLVVIYNLHQRRRARREQRVPNLAFLPESTWTGAPAGGKPVDRWLLLLRLLLALVLIVGVAGPSLPDGHEAGVVLVVDLSASMGAPAPDLPTANRLEVAVERTQEFLQRSRPHRVLVLIAGDTPLAPEGWQSLEEASGLLASLAPGEGRSDLGAALIEARALVPRESVWVLTDDDAPIPGNLAIERFTFRPHLHRIEEGTFLITARRSAGAGPAARVAVAVEVGGQRVGTVPFELLPGESLTASLAYRGAGGVPARARLMKADVLSVDNQVAILLPALTRRHIALVSPGNEELARALAAWPRGRLTTHPAGRHPPADLLVLDGEGGLASDRAAVVIEPPGLEETAPTITVPHGEPIQAGFGALAGLSLRRWRRLPEAPAGAQQLLSAGGRREAPLLWLQASRSPARAYLAFDPGKSGLAGSPLHAVFWADLLGELLLPTDAGCKQVDVGYVSASGPLNRAALYRLEEGCFSVRVPTNESFPAIVSGVEAGDKASTAEPLAPAGVVGPGFALLALLLLALEGLLAAFSRRSHGRFVPSRGS